MKTKQLITIIVFFFMSLSLQAQDSIPKIFTKISFSGGLKEFIVTNNSNFDGRVLDFYLAYKLKNKLSIGLNTGIYYLHNNLNSNLTQYSTFGVGFKYLMFEKEKNKQKKIGFAPYVCYNFASNISSDIDNDSFSYYDIGVNIVVPKTPYFYAGTGVMKNFITITEIAFLSGMYPLV